MEYLDVPNNGKQKFLEKYGVNLGNVPEKIIDVPEKQSIICKFNIDTILVIRDQSKLDYMLNDTEIKSKEWYLLDDKYIKEKRLVNA